MLLCVEQEFDYESHTAENVSLGLKYIAKNAGIYTENYRGVYPTVTTDCAANELAGVRESTLESQKCGAHRLRTCIEDAYNTTKSQHKSFEDMDFAARRIVRKVKKSKLQNLMQPTLKQIVPTLYLKIKKNIFSKNKIQIIL